MIVYNVKRRWFAIKGEAETYRKAEGLKPSATLPVRIEDRDQLAALLNALCEPQATNIVDARIGNLLIPEKAALVDRAYVEPSKDVPLFVPLFLIADPEQRARQKARLEGMSVAELERALNED